LAPIHIWPSTESSLAVPINHLTKDQLRKVLTITLEPFNPIHREVDPSAPSSERPLEPPAMNLIAGSNFCGGSGI
jgi:hypothetical protein